MDERLDKRAAEERDTVDLTRFFIDCLYDNVCQHVQIAPTGVAIVRHCEWTRATNATIGSWPASWAVVFEITLHVRAAATGDYSVNNVH